MRDHEMQPGMKGHEMSSEMMDDEMDGGMMAQEMSPDMTGNEMDGGAMTQEMSPGSMDDEMSHGMMGREMSMDDAGPEEMNQGAAIVKMREPMRFPIDGSLPRLIPSNNRRLTFRCLVAAKILPRPSYGHTARQVVHYLA